VHPKKVFNCKIVPWPKTYFGPLFPKVKSKFFEPVEKDGCFDTPFSLFEEKSSYQTRNKHFLSTKRSKMEETPQHFLNHICINISKISDAITKACIRYQISLMFSK
jgi:hypothetical protein